MAVVTEQFESGANAQGKALGFDPAIIFVEHPIQDRTDAELQQIANDVFEQILQALTVEK